MEIIRISLKWIENCILSSAGTAATFTITDTKLYVPVVTLKTEDNVKLSKLLNEGFERLVYWNKNKIIPNKTYHENDNIRDLLDSSYQAVKRLFVLAYRDQGGANKVTADSHGRYFLPRVKIKNCNIEIFMINQLMI